MILEISIAAVGGLIIGFAFSSFGWKIAYDSLYKVSLKAIKDQHGDNNKIIYARVRAKIADISKITETQIALWGQIDGPNMSAAHSKWKRNLINEINNLESEKMAIFKEILKDGVDLTVSIIESDGTKSNKQMSEIVKEFDIKQLDNSHISNKPTEKTTKENDPNKKLRLVKESKLHLIKDKNHDAQSE